MGIVLTSTLLAAIVATIVAAGAAQRKISIESIPRDRRACREKGRKKALSVHDSLVCLNQESLDKLRAGCRAVLSR